MIKKKTAPNIAKFTSDMMKESMFKRLVYTRQTEEWNV